jgi:low temperature requirement protein LtrA
LCGHPISPVSGAGWIFQLEHIICCFLSVFNGFNLSVFPSLYSGVDPLELSRLSLHTGQNWMSQETRRRWIVPMKPRSAHEPHRAATTLELFFDLVFVVAVAQAAAGLHHSIVENHAPEAIVSYSMAFFGIWWAWMNFTWFASSYDTDDVPYRVIVFVQMTGALIFASGVTRFFADWDLRIAVAGYIVMRIAGMIQWIRAGRADPAHRPTAIRYGLGVGVCQVGWIILLFLPDSVRLIGFIVGVVVELLVPVWAERATPTTWNVHHIVERYGLFTIIVLGETVLSSIVAIQSAIDAGDMNASLTSIIIGGLLIVYVMWWLYFYEPSHDLMKSLRFDFIWGYGHYFIFGATAAVGAGLAVMIDQVAHHTEISDAGAALAVTIPITIYLLSLWTLQILPHADRWLDKALYPVFALLILLTTFLDQPVLLTGILLAALLAIRLVKDQRHIQSQELEIVE